MPDPVWYKSLYWRIAFGFVAMLAALLLAQGLVLVWLTDRVVGWSAQSPQELVTSVAADLSTAITRDPSLTLESYVRDQFSHIYRPFAVVMVDGRATPNRPNGLPPTYLRAVRSGCVAANCHGVTPRRRARRRTAARPRPRRGAHVLGGRGAAEIRLGDGPAVHGHGLTGHLGLRRHPSSSAMFKSVRRHHQPPAGLRGDSELGPR
jgi:hypothetical protein